MATLYQTLYPASGWSFLADWFGSRPRGRSTTGLVDLRTMPDHILRDIGALDGNDPAGRRK